MSTNTFATRHHWWFHTNSDIECLTLSGTYHKRLSPFECHFSSTSRSRYWHPTSWGLDVLTLGLWCVDGVIEYSDSERSGIALGFEQEKTNQVSLGVDVYLTPGRCAWLFCARKVYCRSKDMWCFINNISFVRLLPHSMADWWKAWSCRPMVTVTNFCCRLQVFSCQLHLYEPCSKLAFYLAITSAVRTQLQVQRNGICWCCCWFDLSYAQHLTKFCRKTSIKDYDTSKLLHRSHWVVHEVCNLWGKRIIKAIW